MNEQANIEVVQQAFAYFAQGNVEGILSTLSDDVAWQLPEMENIPYGGKRSGKAGALEFFTGLAETEDVKIFDPQTFVAQGDQVAVYGHYACTVKTTGRELALDFAQLFIVRDGKMVSFREYTDTAATIVAHTKAPTTKKYGTGCGRDQRPVPLSHDHQTMDAGRDVEAGGGADKVFAE